MKQKSFFFLSIFYFSFLFQNSYILCFNFNINSQPIINNIKTILDNITNNGPSQFFDNFLLNNLTQFGIMYYSQIKNQKEYFIKDSYENALYIRQGWVGSLLKYNYRSKSTKKYKTNPYRTCCGLELAWKISINDIFKKDLLSKGKFLWKYQWFISFGLLLKVLGKENAKISEQLTTETHILKIIKNDIAGNIMKDYRKLLKLYLSLTIDFLIPFKFVSNCHIYLSFKLIGMKIYFLSINPCFIWNNEGNTIKYFEFFRYAQHRSDKKKLSKEKKMNYSIEDL